MVYYIVASKRLSSEAKYDFFQTYTIFDKSCGVSRSDLALNNAAHDLRVRECCIKFNLNIICFYGPAFLAIPVLFCLVLFFLAPSCKTEVLLAVY